MCKSNKIVKNKINCKRKQPKIVMEKKNGDKKEEKKEEAAPEPAPAPAPAEEEKKDDKKKHHHSSHSKKEKTPTKDKKKCKQRMSCLLTPPKKKHKTNKIISDLCCTPTICVFNLCELSNYHNKHNSHKNIQFHDKRKRTQSHNLSHIHTHTKKFKCEKKIHN